MPDPLTVREIRMRLRRIHGELEELDVRLCEMSEGVSLRQGVYEEARRWHKETRETRSPWTHSTSRVPERDGKWTKAWQRLRRAHYWLGDARRRVLTVEESLRHLDPAKPELRALRQERRSRRRA